MERIVNPFKRFDDLGIYPELKRFGTGKSPKPLYGFDLYVQGLDTSITLRSGAPSTGETREEATENILKRVEFIYNFAKQHNVALLVNRMFWKGFEYINHYSDTKETTHEFICGQQLRKEFKELFGS